MSDDLRDEAASRGAADHAVASAEGDAPTEPEPEAEPEPEPEPEPAKPPPTPEEIARDRHAYGRQLAAGLLAGFVCVALFNVVVFTILVPLPTAGVGLRVAAVVTSTLETLGFGAMTAGLVYAWLRYVPAPIWVGTLVAGLAGALVLGLTCDVEIYRQASVSVDAVWLEDVLYVVYHGTGLVFPFAILVGGAFTVNRWLALALLVICAVLGVGNELYMRDDYDSVHGLVTFGLALLVGSVLAPRAERVLDRLLEIRGGRAAWAIAGVLGLALVVPPPNAVRLEMFRDPCAFAPWILGWSIWRAPRPRDGVVAPESAWLEKREGLPDAAPTSPPLLSPKGAVVVMVTIDATRAEAVLDPANDEDFPNLASLKADGTVFTHASAPGSQTALCLSTTFSGKMFSELRWDYFGVGVMRFAYPSEDPTPRFPSLLDERGVRTAIISSVNFIDNGFGVVRGFTSEKMVAKARNHAFARYMIDPALEILRHHDDGPLFLYLHLMEPHAPYDRGKRTGTDYERYLSEIAVADRELGRLVRFLDQKFKDRGVLIVGADHGEAFGEHETTGHSKTLYEELLHVPLIVRTPKRVGRVVDQRVLLADVGPTVLDLFGAPTPSTFMGQSLVPFLEGKSPTLTRPLLAEGRLRRSITTPDGMKVIDDPRRTVVEAYDLEKDPKELVDLWGKDPRADVALATLRAFFANNAYRAPGYSPPYKP